MSNLTQFLGNANPIGSTTTLPYAGERVTLPDGTEWMTTWPNTPFAYTSAYAGLPPGMKSAHGFLNGPHGGLHLIGSGNTYAFDGTSTWVIGGVANQLEGDATNGYKYWRSTDGGANWTLLTFPNLKPYSVNYIGGKFVGYAASSTTNGAITSADGASWTTTATTPSITAIIEVLSGGGGQMLVVPSVGTAGAYSTDGGATWTANTFATAIPIANRYYGVGTWNAGAGLYIVHSGTGAYQTSPTGATWTARPAQATYAQYGQFLGQSNTKYASNATVTIAAGLHGFVISTTDGLTWSNPNFVTNNATLVVGNGPGVCFHDGTRFVVSWGDRVFYSTNATSWTEGSRFPPGSTGTNYIVTSNRAVSCYITGTLMKLPVLSDATATTPAYVVPASVTSPTSSGTATYVRIK